MGDHYKRKLQRIRDEYMDAKEAAMKEYQRRMQALVTEVTDDLRREAEAEDARGESG